MQIRNMPLKVAILTSPRQWFESHARSLSDRLGDVPVFTDHLDMNESYDLLFILSYHKIIGSEFLEKNSNNIVVHASNLPEGKGWAPMFWQVLEGREEITFSMIEAVADVDAGDIYLQRSLSLTGYELNAELRLMQAEVIKAMCVELLDNIHLLENPQKQLGAETFYPRRTSEDSRLDVNRSIGEQFNLLRICDNEEYPAFFELGGIRYLLKIEKC